MNHFLSDSLCVLEANGWVLGPHTFFNMGVGTHSCMLESDTWAQHHRWTGPWRRIFCLPLCQAKVFALFYMD